MMTDEPTADASLDRGRPALMCVDNDERPATAVRAVLQQLGFDPETPGDTTEAIAGLRKVAVTHRGRSTTPTAVAAPSTTWSQGLQHDGDGRPPYMFVVLIAADVKSFDHALPSR